MAVSTTTTKIIHVLIIAHPDDESMFFVPLLAYLRSVAKNGNQKSTTTTTKTVDDHSNDDDVIVWIICLTSGNFNNLGAIRENELLNVCYNCLDIQYVYMIDEPSVLADHPNISWPINDAASMIHTALQNCLYRNQHKLVSCNNTNKIHFNLITFDEYGVSGHCNHRDTFYAVQQFFLQQQLMMQQQTQPQEQKFDFYIYSTVGDSSTSDTTAERNAKRIRINTSVSLWTLETVHNPILKYIPILAWIRLIIHWICYSILQHASYMPVVYCSSPQHLLLGKTTTNTMLLQSTTTKTSTTSKKSNHDPSDNNDDTVITIRLNRPLLNWYAMKTHASQFVWYRRLFVIFSIYTYENRIRPIKVYR